MANDNKNYVRQLNEGHLEFLEFSQNEEERVSQDTFLCERLLETSPWTTKQRVNGLSGLINTPRIGNVTPEPNGMKETMKQYQMQKILIKERRDQRIRQEQIDQLTLQQRIVEKELVSLEKTYQQRKQHLLQEHAEIAQKVKQLNNELTVLNHENAAKPKRYPSSGDSRCLQLPKDFQPSAQTLKQLEMLHGIPESFCFEQYSAFVTYYSDTQDARRSWQTVFMKWVLRSWEQMGSVKTLINASFVPSKRACVLLEQANIPKSFYESQIAAFILFWSERGEKHNTWDSKFIQHVNILWERHKKFGAHSDRSQHQTLHEKLTDESWAEEDVQFTEVDWGTFKG